MFCSHVRQVVAVYRGEDDISQVHLLHRFRHALRLVGVERERTSAQRVTEAAVACADVAANHQRGSTHTPALGTVGAKAALADRVKAVAMDDLRGALALLV